MQGNSMGLIKKKIGNFLVLMMGVAIGVGLCLAPAGMSFERVRSESLSATSAEKLKDISELIRDSYVEPTSDKKLLEHAIKGMVAGLDPHSAYLTGDALKELRSETSGKFTGIGAELNLENGLTSIVSPIEGSPAEKAGIMSGDVILKVDGKPVSSTLEGTVRRIRGPAGSPVKLSLMKKANGKVEEVTIVRQEIKSRSVKSRLDDNILYLRVSRFSEDTGTDLAQAMRKHGDGTNVKGVVLDLRGNPGGLLNQAVAVSAPFVEEGAVIVSIKGRISGESQVLKALPSQYADSAAEARKMKVDAKFKKLPMAVLIDSGSASASEIVAGALHDLGRAKLFGTRTFGKGSVQTIFNISADEAVKITTQRYYTPDGSSIQNVGISPDFFYRSAEEEKLASALSREEELAGRIENDHLKVTKPESEGYIPELPEGVKRGDQADPLVKLAEGWLTEGHIKANP